MREIKDIGYGFGEETPVDSQGGLGSLPNPEVGKMVKVWLPGETPWAECIAVHPDGTWEGRIANRLFAEMSDEERALVLGEMWNIPIVPGPKPRLASAADLPRLHGYKQDQVVRFRRGSDTPIWEPAESPGGNA